MKVKDIVSILASIAPKSLIVDGDNSGLQVGNDTTEVSKVVIALDPAEEVVDFAVEQGANLLITHHPLIFSPIRSINTNLPMGRVISKAIIHNLTIYSAHSNLDLASNGVSKVLADKIGLTDLGILREIKSEKLYKLVVFVPVSHFECVRDAVCNAGAGWIGNYSSCTFQLEGTGTFLPREGTNPFIGQAGQLEKVEEIRIETVMPEGKKKEIITAMLKAHPYEEVAYDIYLLENSYKGFGYGNIGRLPETIDLKTFAEFVKIHLGCPEVRVFGDLSKKLKKVAVCGGSGSSLLKDAIIKNADVFVTGDIKYHDAQEALRKKIAVIDAGHFYTENPVVSVLTHYLRNEINKLAEKDKVEIVAFEQSLYDYNII